jgi:hypothetical protein
MKMAPCNLSYHYVAFIDLLGFSAMVEADCNGPSSGIRYFPKLFEIHKRITNLTEEISGSSITQFSDSIVIAVPFGLQPFSTMLNLIGQYQFLLLEEGILCRGGISYGKHFQQSSFLFSEGLIRAYRIESEQAKYPRIVVDRDVIELVVHKELEIYDLLIEEADGAVFLDFLRFGDPKEVNVIVSKVTDGFQKLSGRAREKHRWLREYFGYRYPEQSGFDCSRFKVILKP